MSELVDPVDRFVVRAGGLYSLPAVAVEVLELTENPQVDTAALKQCIENDPALTTKILKVVNSSLFGLSREVCDLNQALALLGTKPLKLLVLGFSLPERLFAGLAGETLSRYWRHTLTKAIAGRELCETIWKQPGDEAFIAGLLGDLGELVLIQDLGEPYINFLDKVFEENGDLLALETDALNFDHAQLSARLLDQWSLPRSLTSAIAIPKDPKLLSRLPSEEATLPQVLHLSELLAQLVAENRINALPELLESGREYHQITREQITRLVETLGEKVMQLSEVLSLDMPDGLDYRDVLIRAHERLSQAAEGAAGELLQSGQAQRDPCEDLLEEARSLSRAASQVACAHSPLPAPQVSLVTDPETPGPPGNDSTPQQDVTTTTSAAASESGSPINSESDSVDPGIVGRLDAAVIRCQRTRNELSLLIVETDRFDELVMHHGQPKARKLTRLVELACRSLDHPEMTIVGSHATGFYLILADCDRQLAASLGGQLVRQVHDLVENRLRGGPVSMSVSIGSATVASPPKNFDSQTLIESAQRCLYGAQSSGGNGVKSIEIY